MKTFFQRMLAVALRICSQCEDEIPEGTVYFMPKNRNIWCGSCVDYERAKE